MIISQTPYRISFLGGGTDYPAYFEKHGGAVLGTAIDKSGFISVTHFHARLFDYSVRIAYRQVECVKTIDELQHAPFRECLRRCGIFTDVEINYTGELPAFSGLGASSSFVVGLLNALHAYRSESVRPLDLAREAIEIEQDVLKEAVGCQDQAFAALGGLRVIEFRPGREIVAHAVPLAHARLEEFQQHLLVFHTGIRRRAADAAAEQIRNVGNNLDRLASMRRMVDDGYDILTGSGSLDAFGELLHEGWVLKSELDPCVAIPPIRAMYEDGLRAGALGGKLLGAGSGGCMLFFTPPEKHEAVRAALKHLVEIPVKINAPGSRIVYA